LLEVVSRVYRIVRSQALIDRLWQGYKLFDMVESVRVEERNPNSCGRAYTCGVSNVGVFPHPIAYSGVNGQVVFKEGFFATR
jgi:hypothetical protein